ncbi:hypothetical protein GCM10007989_03220 [Devosia pacifica]|uniref:DUF2188 domain-containing protein n=1 Tax=Devosia pacifica TaxID=1335967 RepID=A0A918RU85_9HYPH|nr:DUF2188 domain-containing protein [Devosia pacifica]GHA12154.1 hypothetical protein GCM10007989_03220 [Devosia pacifica]
MANDKNYWTVKHPDGWAVKREGAERATSVHSTQAEAWKETKERAKKTEGEAFLQGEDGQIRERNTYGHDPSDIPG